MIQFTIQDQHKKTLKITAPHSWRELNLKQLIDIENTELQKNGLTKLFSIICGVEFADIVNSTDKTMFKKVTDVCSFITSPPDWKRIECPDYIEFGGKNRKVKMDVSKLMHGQIELITEIGRNKKNLLELIPRIIAIVMQPSIDEGDYNGDRVEEIEKEVLESSGLDAYGLGSFFFQRLERFLNIGILNSIASQKLTTRTEKFYTDWLKETGSVDLVH